MDIAVVEYVALITISSWLGLYLQICHRFRSAHWYAGVAYFSYGFFLLVRALGFSIPGSQWGDVLVRVAYLPACVALLAFYHTGWIMRYPKRPAPHAGPHAGPPPGSHAVLIALALAGATLVVLSIASPLVLRGIMPLSFTWGRLDFGPLHWLWLVYTAVTISLGLLHMACAHVGQADSLSYPHAPHAARLAAIILVTISIVLNHLSAAYLPQPFSLSTLLIAGGSAYIAYLFITRNSRALRERRANWHEANLVLVDLSAIFIGSLVVLLGIVLVARYNLPLVILIIGSYWTALLTAAQVGARHALQASFHAEIRKLNGQLRHFPPYTDTPIPAPTPARWRLTALVNTLGQALASHGVYRLEQQGGVWHIHNDYVTPAPVPVPTLTAACPLEQRDHGFSAWRLWPSPISSPDPAETMRSASLSSSYPGEFVRSPSFSSSYPGEAGRSPSVSSPYQGEAGRGSDHHPSPAPHQPDAPRNASHPQEIPPPAMDKPATDPPDHQALYKELRLALRHLHNPARLGNIDLLAGALPGETPWQRGQSLQQRLIAAIQSLVQPGPGTSGDDRPAAGPLWQHYQILWRLYYHGHSRLDIMRDLSLSERHYQRQLHNALEELMSQWQKLDQQSLDNSN